MSFLRDPKRLITTLIAGICGLLVLIDFVNLRILSVSLVAQIIVSWATIISAIALFIGMFSVASNHVRRVQKRSADWVYSLILVGSMLAVVISGTIISWTPKPGGGMGFVAPPQSLVEQSVRDIFRAVYQPLTSALLGLLTFFSLSAALRAIQRRSTDALVIVIVASLVLLIGALPGNMLLPILPAALDWMASYIALAGARALLIGAALGAIVAGVRVLLGFDQPFLDR